MIGSAWRTTRESKGNEHEDEDEREHGETLLKPAVDPPLDTAEPTPPESATVFTGPSEGNVETLTFDGDVVCSAPAGSDYTGTVELSCSDGSSIGAPGSALTPDGVAEATVEGVWSPVLTPGGAAQPVVAATRG